MKKLQGTNINLRRKAVFHVDINLYRVLVLVLMLMLLLVLVLTICYVDTSDLLRWLFDTP